MSIRKRTHFTLRSIGVLRAGHRRHLQLHSIQDPMAGVESLAADCLVRRKGGRVTLATGRKTS